MDNKTKYSKFKFNGIQMIGLIIGIPLILLIVYLLIYWYIKMRNEYVGTSSMIYINIIFITIFLVMFLPTIFSVIGTIQAKNKISREDKSIEKENLYLYLRELPNNYGIGVNTLLMDSTIENYKDIVAVILDLCAKKYLHLEKKNNSYMIKILKDNDNNLLQNEKYIISLIKNNNIKNIDYDKWYNYCLDDGRSLELYNHEDVATKRSHIDIDIPGLDKFLPFISGVISGIISIYVYMFLVKNLNYDVMLIKAIGSLIFAIIAFALLFKIVILIITLLCNLLVLLLSLLSFPTILKFAKDEEYMREMNNHLIRTQKGIEEYKKLLAFKAFINDFGVFASKHVEEVKLWDHYLSYAQLFGLTKNIMNSGYKELVVNSSFSIDDFDSINFDNIEIEK